MPYSIALYLINDSLEGPELIHVPSERELTMVMESQIEICELNGLGLISLTPMWVDDVEFLFYFCVYDEQAFDDHLDQILDYVAEDFGLPRETLTRDKNHIIPLTA